MVAVRLMTVEEVATRLRVSRATVCRHIRTGRLRASNVGTGRYSIYRIDPKDFDDFCAGTAVITEKAHRPQVLPPGVRSIL
jgi:excisionase family DNA binding protein